MPIDLEGNGEDAPLFNRPFVAEITAKSGTTPIVYSWKEVVPEPGGTGYEDADPGRTGDATSQPAYELNNVDLDVGTLVRIHCRGVQDEELTFGIEAPGLGGSLTVEEEDGAPSYSGVTTLQFDQNAGFVVTEPTPNVALVSLSGLTAKEVDGTPSYSGTTSLEFDQADGFSLSQPGAGRARVDLLPASASQDGIVDRSSQTFSGTKTFDDAIVAETSPGSSIDYNRLLIGPSGNAYVYTSASGLGVTALFGVRVDSARSGVNYIDLTLDGKGLILTGSDGASTFDWPALRIQNEAGTMKEGADATFAGLTFVAGVLVDTPAFSADLTSDVTGVLPIANGGTGGATAPDARTALGLGPLATASSVNLASEVSGTLGTSNGGTGLTSTPGAGTLLTGTGSGYAQSSALAFATMWGVD